MGEKRRKGKVWRRNRGTREKYGVFPNEKEHLGNV
jgi:hypothetical protein